MPRHALTPTLTTPYTALMATAQALMVAGKGLLAMDESTDTCNQRFAALAIPQTVEMRRAYRTLLVTTPRLGEAISGAILADETIRQQLPDGTPFVAALEAAGIITGIKVDLGAHPLAGFPGEKATDGLDGLRERLADYAQFGARFAKWRAVIGIGPALPTRACLEANVHALARYAALCQEAGLVPIVEPEVLLVGIHPLARCAAVTEEVLSLLFGELHTQGVRLEGLLLKPAMVLAGPGCPQQPSVAEVADATLASLRRTVPAAVAGIAFLSGGQTPEQASAHLNAMHVRHAGHIPWPLTFSFARAIQQPALDIWRGHAANVPAAQAALFARASANAAARRGE